MRGTKGEDHIEGQLIDNYGPSRITGAMSEEALDFTKEYLKCNEDEIYNYSFKLKEGIWRGEFTSMDTGYTNRSICRTNKILGNLEFKRSPRNPEEWADQLIEGMIDSGQLKIEHDSKRDEDIVLPN